MKSSKSSRIKLWKSSKKEKTIAINLKTIFQFMRRISIFSSYRRRSMIKKSSKCSHNLLWPQLSCRRLTSEPILIFAGSLLREVRNSSEFWSKRSKTLSPSIKRSQIMIIQESLKLSKIFTLYHSLGLALIKLKSSTLMLPGRSSLRTWWTSLDFWSLEERSLSLSYQRKSETLFWRYW